MGRGGLLAGAALWSAGVLFGSPAAHAQGTQSAVAAEALFESARADVGAGNIEAACSKFAESQRLDPAVGTLINLADCEERRMHLAAAWQLWREATDQLAPDDSRKPVVIARRDAIERRVPRLTIRLGPGVPRTTASLRRDDVELPMSAVDLPLPIDPGPHIFELVVAGHASTRKVVTVAESARDVVVLELGPADSPPRADSAPPVPAPADAPADDGRTLRILGFSALGVGVVGLGAGAITGLLAIEKKSDQEKNCYPINVCTPAGSDAAASGSTLATLSTVGFVLGGVGLVSGGALLWISHSKSGRKPATAVAPLSVPGGLGLALTGTL